MKFRLQKPPVCEIVVCIITRPYLNAFRRGRVGTGPYAEGSNRMAYKITDACTNCGACEAECPFEAIQEKGGARWIDPDICSSCGTCADSCPVGAIEAD
jgi:ferredoxin